MNARTTRRAYVDVGELQIHYRYTPSAPSGEVTKPTLLMLHQSPSHSAMYEPLIALLADTFHIVAPDNPGFGNSDPLPSGKEQVQDYAAVIRGLVEALQLAPCFIFGHHAGAAIAVQLEHDFPGTARALALSGPPLLDDATRAVLPGLATPFPEVEDGSHLLQMWQRIRNKDLQAPLSISQRETLSALASGDAYHASYTAVAAQDFAGLLPAIDCPVLAFAAGEDPLLAGVAPTLALLSDGQEGQLGGRERTYVCEKQAQDVSVLLTEFFLKQERAQ
ncbi:4,5:9,10-diseco-3-hydroxy-5,9,17-trioxoandrosta-1 (10),2-diene-4-oate hydrolase [Halioglobus japonicus]|nr:4,5:9,10-diseco-3-hydroxy-5,9,17-trioxoandrosta-1 (10),2-diene-4-oate hydrolase [Halioglobus japonicus]